MSQRLLDSFDLTHADLLGEGGEAQVYALDADRVVRIYRPGTTLANAQARTELLAEIAAGAQHLPFVTPQVVETGVFEEQDTSRVYVIEKRIPGTSMLQALQHSSGSTRAELIRQYMDAAWQLGTLKLQRPFFGEISHDDAVQTATLQAYLTERARRSLSGSNLDHVDPAALARALGEPISDPAFVHIDYFPGNVMVDGNRLNGVIDFGYSSIIGDRRMTVMAAAAHLVSPRISPTVTAADRTIALEWLRARDLYGYYERGTRWLAAYWSFVPEEDDPAAHAWASSILRGSGPE